MKYPIPESIYASDEPEWAIAAVLGDRVVALLHLADIAPTLVPHLDTISAEFHVKQWARKATPDFQQLQALGDVSAGVLTTDGFEAHWRLASWRPNDQLPEDA